MIQVSVAEEPFVCGWCDGVVDEGEKIAQLIDEQGWFHIACAEELAKVTAMSMEQIVAEADEWLEAHPDALLGDRVAWALISESGGQENSTVSLDRVAERLGTTFENVQAILQEISEPVQ